MIPDSSLLSFTALNAYPAICHGFVGRIPGIPVDVEKDEALRRLETAHEIAREKFGLTTGPCIVGEQVHGNDLAIVDQNTTSPIANVDGLLCRTPGIYLGVYVADCCAVYIADPVQRAIALLHSGKKGTELAITRVAIERMQKEFGTRPEDLVVQLSPCIRPPHYEVDFAAKIREQAEAAGVKQVFDCGICTACDPERYYSYRRESGKTGRMLALMALSENP